jgi:uncharacterized membrane protein
MGKGRLEAFSDGVVAIIITILVLEMKVPQDDDGGALRPLVPVFVSYVLSFTNISLYICVAVMWFILDRRIERVIER